MLVHGGRYGAGRALYGREMVDAWERGDFDIPMYRDSGAETL